MNLKTQVTALLISLFIQVCFVGLFFIGGLMDPLICIWMGVIYFIIVGTTLLYQNTLNRLLSKPGNSA